MNDKADKNVVYVSMKQCSAATGVSMGILRAAKCHKDSGTNGFKPNNRIHWDKAEPFIQAHLHELETAENDSLTKWRTKKTRAEAFLAEIELEEAKKKYLLKEEVESTIKAIALAQKTILKAKLTQELPSRLLGLDAVAMSVELEKVLNEVCKLMETLEIK